ncbi:phospho-sugar mutase [Sedimentibacter hydroxybenzoicus DSM 7310]|uniref:Phosphoglucomutase n=1 Tax=Sedimentibacter hydroxybenzoicus DSM 7310 TaxID=1123245 RepID=A0A974BHB7_SEDHY|nr:phospho-sugar mutase [Sedimentibacter hydroxybenzoicus]NYB73189.1 phospho-sugar mutase [Sedimentibacter hydroxybenzoicus DSM 7310]
MSREKYEMWLDSPYVDDILKEELKLIENDDHEIEDRFYRELEFGTGGMRGKIGAGSNRINIVTVAKATQGISNFLKEKYKDEEISAAIAYDSRYMSKEFAEKAACVFAANNINVYLFEGLRPTPELSYAVRHFKCKAGVVITASHNPSDYNGYKVYDQYGGQVVEDADVIISSIEKVMLRDIICSDLENNEKITVIGNDVDTSYIDEIKKLSLNSDVEKDIKVVYTPLHGTGNMLVRRVLAELGYKNIFVVKEQENPDPEFSTVKSPNPEEISSFEMAIKKAQESDADIILGTDPDCDRVGLVVKNAEGDYEPLNGNQTGALLINYVLGSLKEKDKLPHNGAVVNTIVTSEIGRAIAEKYNVSTFNTLTGFKYIAELMQNFEETRDHSFLFGYEESYGYLAGTFVRDKDAVIASMLICEMSAYYKTKGKLLLDILQDIYEEHGYYIEETISLSFAGLTGLNKMRAIMDDFRENKLRILAGKNIPYFYDYKLGIVLNLTNGNVEKLNYPKSDVLKFLFEDGSWLVLRPSGTEPKLKIYFSIKGVNKIDSMNVLKRVKEEVLNLIDRVQIHS